MKKNLRSTFEPKLCNKFARAFLITQDFEAGIEKFEGKIFKCKYLKLESK